MNVVSDFECGNGKNIAEIAPGHWRVDEVGEKAPYCKYFCVRVEAGDDGGAVRLDIYPDPDMGEEGRLGMLHHYPAPLWFCQDEEMSHWVHITNRWPEVESYGLDHLSTQVVVPPGGSLYVASNVVLSWTRLKSWAEGLAERGAVVDSLGDSFEGREIPRLRLPATASGSARRVFVFSGQHPSEHCGPLAACGIAEFLCSSHPEAVAIRRRCEVWLVPNTNVDGTFHGRNGWTMEDVNPCTDFEGACDGEAPKATEDRLLWNWLSEDLQPEVAFNFHGYLGRRRFADFPYDGCYVLQNPEKVFASEDRRQLYAAVRDTLFWDTPGLTASSRPGTVGHRFLSYNLAKKCGTIVPFYEINHGFHGVQAAKRKGAEVFRAVMRTVLGL